MVRKEGKKMREKRLKMFKGICELSKNSRVTERIDNGYRTYFVFANGEVIEGFGLSEEESIRHFEDSVCVEYEAWGL